MLVQPSPENVHGFLRQVAASSPAHFGLIWLSSIGGFQLANELLTFDWAASTIHYVGLRAQFHVKQLKPVESVVRTRDGLLRWLNWLAARWSGWNLNIFWWWREEKNTICISERATNDNIVDCQIVWAKWFVCWSFKRKMKTVGKKERSLCLTNCGWEAVNQLFVSRESERERVHFISNCQNLTVRLIQENNLAACERDALPELCNSIQ